MAVLRSVVALPLALVPLFAGIGILRRRAWSAYGYAVCVLAGFVLLPLVHVSAAQLTAETIFSLLIGALFLLAGRALARAGAERGRAWPWIAVAAVTTLPLIFFEPFILPTGSMENTILSGDRILARRLPKPVPARDETIVFIYPIDRKQVFVKRVAGMPGDRIRISNKILYRNGVRLSEPWAIHKSDYLDSYRDNFPSEPHAPLYPAATAMLANNVVNGEVLVPPGRYFALGDNRDQSLDSRYWGFVSDADIIGAPVMVYDSIEPPQSPDVKPNPFQLGHRRWDRLFKLL